MTVCSVFAFLVQPDPGLPVESANFPECPAICDFPRQNNNRARGRCSQLLQTFRIAFCFARAGSRLASTVAGYRIAYIHICQKRTCFMLGLTQILLVQLEE